VMTHIFRYISLKIAASSLIFTQGLSSVSFAQSLGNYNAPAVSPQCDEGDGPIYLAAQRRVIPGQIRACANGVFDVTRGVNAPSTGEQMMISTCRLQRQSPKTFIRARMNVAYLLNPSDEEDMTMTPYVGISGYELENSARALPFTPRKILNLGTQKGYPTYGYTDLQFLPSRINDAYPLNNRSVVIAIDSCAISSENMLGAILHNPGVKDYVEVTYFQEGDASRAFYRAYIPMYPRHAVERELSQLVRVNPVFRRDGNGRIMSYAAIFVLTTLVVMFMESPTGKRMAEERRECERTRTRAIKFC